MNLPLQPDLNPWPPLLKRALLVLCTAGLVFSIGCLVPRRTQPPEAIIGGARRELDYAGTAQRLIASANQRIWVAMYVVHPDDDGPVSRILEALVAAVQRGVDVRVCLDQDPQDDKHVAAEAWLRSHGIKVILDEPTRTTHAKVLVVDSRWVLAGSHNWTRRALTANREVSWLVDDPHSATDLERWLSEIPGW